MNPSEIAAWCLVLGFASLLVIALGGNHNLTRELRNERAARKVADAAYEAEARAHNATVQAWALEPFTGATPIYQHLVRRRGAFNRTAAEIQALPEVNDR